MREVAAAVRTALGLGGAGKRAGPGEYGPRPAVPDGLRSLYDLVEGAERPGGASGPEVHWPRGTVVEGAKGLTEGAHVRVPLAWFGRLTETKRGVEAPNTDAILVLAYVVARFAGGHVEPPGVLYVGVEKAGAGSVPTHPSVGDALRLTTDRRKGAIRYLSGRGLLERVVIKGTVPWWPEPRTRGSYLFVVPNVAAVRELNDDGGGE